MFGDRVQSAPFPFFGKNRESGGEFMKNTVLQNDWYGREKISKILLKVAPPVMLAQLIQALYNIVDSFFRRHVLKRCADGALGHISDAARYNRACGRHRSRSKHIHGAQIRTGAAEGRRSRRGCGTVLALVSWALFAALSLLFMRPYVKTSATSPEAVEYAVIYGNIVCAGSVGVFLEGNWTKVHQARGNMRRPMIAQITGALTNIILDPIPYIRYRSAPEMGVAAPPPQRLSADLCGGDRSRSARCASHRN